MLKKFLIAVSKSSYKQTTKNKATLHSSFSTFQQRNTKKPQRSVFLQSDEVGDVEEYLKNKMKLEKVPDESTIINGKNSSYTTSKDLESYIKTHSSTFLNSRLLSIDKTRISAEILSELVCVTYLYMDDRESFKTLFNTKNLKDIENKVRSKPFSKKSLQEYLQNRVTYFAEDNFHDLPVKEYVAILKCLEGTELLSECAHLLQSLQKCLKKELLLESVSIADYIYLLRTSTYMLQDPYKYNQKILLFNLDYLNEQQNFFSGCSVTEIEEILNCYDKILAHSLRINISNCLQRSFQNLAQELNVRLKKDLDQITYGKNAISNPRVLFMIIKAYRRMALNPKELYEVVEMSLIRKFEIYVEFPIKTFLVGFRLLTSVNHGSKLLANFWSSYQNGKLTKSVLRNYDKQYILEFVQCLVRLEVHNVYANLEFKPKDDFFYVERESLEKGLKENVMLQQNAKVHELMLQEVLDLNYFEEILRNGEDEKKARIYQVLFWLEGTNRISAPLLEIKAKIVEELTSKFKKSGSLLFRHQQGIHNEFVADISYILQTENIAFMREYPLLIKSCDFALHDRKVIIELDGVYHFFMDDLKTSFVDNRFRNLFVVLNGWRLFEINFLHWDTVRLNQNMRETFLRQLNSLEENKDWAIICNSY